MAVAFTRTASPASVNSNGSGVATYSSISIGTAADDRVVAVPVVIEVASRTINSATIDFGTGAQAMTAVGAASFGNLDSVIFYASAPTGTTATIAITFSGQVLEEEHKIAVYSVTGSSGAPTSSGSDTSSDMDATDPLTTGSITVPSGGGFLAVAGGATDTNAKTWANTTEDLDLDWSVGRFTTAFDTTASTRTVTCTGTSNGEDGVLSWVVFSAGVQAFTLVAAVGTFVLSGVAATLKSARQFAAAVGTFTLTGIAATLTWVEQTAYELLAEVGTFTLNGITATLKSARLFAAAVGTYTFTGRAVSWGRGMGAFVGSYTLTGIAALKHIVLTHVAGAYTFTGRAVSWGRSFTALATSFALNGVAVVWRRSIAHNVGAFTLTGRATFQKITKVVFAGAYTFTGQIATWGRGMAASVGAFTLTGIGAGLAKMLRDIQFFKRRKVAAKLASHRSGDPTLVNRNHAPSLAARRSAAATLNRRLVED